MILQFIGACVERPILWLWRRPLLQRALSAIQRAWPDIFRGAETVLLIAMLALAATLVILSLGGLA